MTLKRIIKHRITGLYYAGNSVWTNNPEDAHVFEDLSLAFQAAHADGLEDCVVVVLRPGRAIDQFPIS